MREQKRELFMAGREGNALIGSVRRVGDGACVPMTIISSRAAPGCQLVIAKAGLASAAHTVELPAHLIVAHTSSTPNRSGYLPHDNQGEEDGEETAHHSTGSREESVRVCVLVQLGGAEGIRHENGVTPQVDGVSARRQQCRRGGVHAARARAGGRKPTARSGARPLRDCDNEEEEERDEGGSPVDNRIHERLLRSVGEPQIDAYIGVAHAQPRAHKGQCGREANGHGAGGVYSEWHGSNRLRAKHVGPLARRPCAAGPIETD